MIANYALTLSDVGARSEPEATIDRYIRPLVRDLHKVRPCVFWGDLLASSFAGWVCVIVAVVRRANGLRLAGLVVLAALFLYRALCFIHEISHQSSRTLPGFETAYNALIGFPLLMPSFMYVGVHQFHHRVDIYGTEGDPEYLPFSRSWLMTIVFAVQSLLIPIALLVRFLLLTPVSLLVPGMHTWLVAHFSSLTMNRKFCRPVTAALSRRVRRDSFFVFGLWGSALACSVTGLTTWHWVTTCLAVLALVSFANTMRTLGAHAYESTGQPMDREAQLRDSIDTPGAFWTELWAPVGLRYHALHHYFPGIPYHNLPEAYRRVVHCWPVAEKYRRMSSPSLPHSLRELLRRGRSKL